MKKKSQRVSKPDQKENVNLGNGSTRRAFFGQLGGAAAATAALSALGPLAAVASAEVPSGGTGRADQSQKIRILTANKERAVAIPPHTTNGDQQRYSDKSASYTKGLLQDSYALVNPAAWTSFKTACNSGSPSDWDNIIIGGTHTENGPQGAYCFDLMGTDSGQFGNAPSPENQENLVVVPPFAQVTSTDYGQQLVEQYWGALLRDVAFTDYAGNTTAIQAAAEMSTFPDYKGPRNSSGQVTPDLLFRGGFPGETLGPYISQFMITPTSFGQQPISQQMTTYVPNVDYMTDIASWFAVQNGNPSGTNQKDPNLQYLHDGRGLAAWTHNDVLYQGYFIALLVLGTLGVPLNPGNPYAGNRTQNGFDTFGGPDFAASMGEIAARALHKVWYQKWLIHLTHRPEAGGGLVQLQFDPSLGSAQAKVNRNCLNSQAVAQTFSKYGSWLVPQAFPEGSPYHPSYPTGHGTVAGACITLLKFFFDGNYVIPSPLVPSDDGLSLLSYTGGDTLTVCGELNKLAHNVSFGHGIHAGIHWRSDSDQSIILGEAYAISMLQDKARCYNEKFTVSFQKLDGTTATISNQ